MKKDAMRKEVLTRQEVNMVVKLAIKQFYIKNKLSHLAVVFLLLTGMRVNELIALRFEDVDIEQRQLSINKEYKYPKEIRETIFGRTIDLVDDAIKIVELAKRCQEKNGGAMKYIFSMTEDPVSRESISSCLRAYSRMLGIPISLGKLRKTYASMMASANISFPETVIVKGRPSDITAENWQAFFVDISNGSDTMDLRTSPSEKL